MNTNFKIGEKVKIQKRSEHSEGFSEIARGWCIGLAQGKNTDYIKFIEDKNSGLDPTHAESIPVESNCIRVVKW